MKRLTAILMALALALAPAMALAEGEAYTSYTTGLSTTREYKPMVVQMDNEPGARPQKGISKADVVYEVTLYNGGYTRYTAVFQDTIPHLVEACRSARCVNVDLYSEWGGGFVHYGGQSYGKMNVYEYMKKVVPDAEWDGLYDSKNFWRDKNRKAPNNVYIHLDEMIQTKEFSATPRSPLTFSADNPTIKGDDVTSFGIPYRKKSYFPSYKYNAEEGVYYRYYNGKQLKDGDDGTPITCSNVIIMYAQSSWSDGDDSAPVVNLFTTGKADYFIGGKHFSGTWSRGSAEENTVYQDGEGNVVNFKPGKTYIQVVKEDQAVEIG